MIKIFAEFGTSKKVLVVCQVKEVRNIQLGLSEKYGGKWVQVDDFDPMREILLFDDGLKYQGFHGKDERYCSAINTFEK